MKLQSYLSAYCPGNHSYQFQAILRFVPRDSVHLFFFDTSNMALVPCVLCFIVLRHWLAETRYHSNGYLIVLQIDENLLKLELDEIERYGRKWAELQAVSQLLSTELQAVSQLLTTCDGDLSTPWPGQLGIIGKPHGSTSSMCWMGTVCEYGPSKYPRKYFTDARRYIPGGLTIQMKLQ